MALLRLETGGLLSPLGNVGAGKVRERAPPHQCCLTELSVIEMFFNSALSNVAATSHKWLLIT